MGRGRGDRARGLPGGLGEFPVEIDAAFSTGPCDPSLTGYILGDAGYDPYLLVDLDVLDSGSGATGEVLTTAIDLYFDGTEYLQVLLIENCAAQPLTERPIAAA